MGYRVFHRYLLKKKMEFKRFYLNGTLKCSSFYFYPYLRVKGYMQKNIWKNHVMHWGEKNIMDKRKEGNSTTIKRKKKGLNFFFFQFRRCIFFFIYIFFYFYIFINDALFSCSTTTRSGEPPDGLHNKKKRGECIYRRFSGVGFQSSFSFQLEIEREGAEIFFSPFLKSAYRIEKERRSDGS